MKHKKKSKKIKPDPLQGSLLKWFTKDPLPVATQKTSPVKSIAKENKERKETVLITKETKAVVVVATEQKAKKVVVVANKQKEEKKEAETKDETLPKKQNQQAGSNSPTAMQDEQKSVQKGKKVAQDKKAVQNEEEEMCDKGKNEKRDDPMIGSSEDAQERRGKRKITEHEETNNDDGRETTVNRKRIKTGGKEEHDVAEDDQHDGEMEGEEDDQNDEEETTQEEEVETASSEESTTGKIKDEDYECIEQIELKNKYKLMRSKSGKRYYLMEKNGQKGGTCKISEEDFDLVKNYAWCNDQGYTISTISNKLTGIQETVKMHRLLMGLKLGDKRQVDHKNFDKSDNRRENLSILTARENGHRKPRQGGKLKRGVDKSGDKFAACCQHEGKRVCLGSFKTEREAAEQRDLFCVKVGVNAELNYENLRSVYETRKLILPRQINVKEKQLKIKTIVIPDTKNPEISRFVIISKNKKEYTVEIDTEDTDLVQYSTWYCNKGGLGYIASCNGQLHRLVKKAKPDQKVDHKKGNRLDCKKSSLRFTNATGNAQNKSKFKNTTSRYFNVSKTPNGYFAAKLVVEKRKALHASFKEEKEAAGAVDLFILNTFKPGEILTKRNFVWNEEEVKHFAPLVEYWSARYKENVEHWNNQEGYKIGKQEPRNLKGKELLNDDFLMHLETIELSDDCKSSHAQLQT